LPAAIKLKKTLTQGPGYEGRHINRLVAQDVIGGSSSRHPAWLSGSKIVFFDPTHYLVLKKTYIRLDTNIGNKASLNIAVDGLFADL
jgi:hypothetical protein